MPVVVQLVFFPFLLHDGETHANHIITRHFQHLLLPLFIGVIPLSSLVINRGLDPAI